MGMLPLYSADSKKDAATSSRRALDYMYRISRAAVFSSISLVVILASVGVVNRATIASYAGTSLSKSSFVRPTWFWQRTTHSHPWGSLPSCCLL